MKVACFNQKCANWEGNCCILTKEEAEACTTRITIAIVCPKCGKTTVPKNPYQSIPQKYLLCKNCIEG